MRGVQQTHPEIAQAWEFSGRIFCRSDSSDIFFRPRQSRSIQMRSCGFCRRPLEEHFNHRRRIRRPNNQSPHCHIRSAVTKLMFSEKGSCLGAGHFGSSSYAFQTIVFSMSESVAKVVFIRHGESQGNAKNVYTGWDDTPLSIKGEQEAEEAGLCLKAKGLKFDICFTSALQLLGRNLVQVLF